MLQKKNKHKSKDMFEKGIRTFESDIVVWIVNFSFSYRTSGISLK